MKDLKHSAMLENLRAELKALEEARAEELEQEHQWFERVYIAQRVKALRAGDKR